MMRRRDQADIEIKKSGVVQFSFLDVPVEVVITGTTPGFEHYHGVIKVSGRAFTYSARPGRKCTPYIVHGTGLHAYSIEKLARKIIRLNNQ